MNRLQNFFLGFRNKSLIIYVSLQPVRSSYLNLYKIAITRNVLKNFEWLAYVPLLNRKDGPLEATHFVSGLSVTFQKMFFLIFNRFSKKVIFPKGDAYCLRWCVGPWR